MTDESAVKLLRQAIIDLLESDCPFDSDEGTCECGENGNGYDAKNRPCAHIKARRALEKTKS